MRQIFAWGGEQKNVGVWLDRGGRESKRAKEQLSVRLSVTSFHIPVGPELLWTLGLITAMVLIHLFSLTSPQSSIITRKCQQNEASVDHVAQASAAPFHGKKQVWSFFFGSFTRFSAWVVVVLESPPPRLNRVQRVLLPNGAIKRGTNSMESAGLI